MKQGESNQDKSSEPTREEAVARMKQRMEEDERARREGRPLPQAERERGGMSDFIKGFLLTAIPATAVGIGSAVGYRTSGGFNYGLGYSFLWLLGPLAFLVTMIVGLTAAAFKTKNARAGVLAGIGVAVVSLGVSCFTMSTM
jgi:hypothetical protein